MWQLFTQVIPQTDKALAIKRDQLTTDFSVFSLDGVAENVNLSVTILYIFFALYTLIIIGSSIVDHSLIHIDE